MIYYNQNQYKYIPYPAKGYEKATLQTAGCGVLCASMVVENLTDYEFSPSECAYLSIQIGARVPGGTDMHILSSDISERFGLSVKETSSKTEMLSCLQNGGLVIANVGGDREGYRGVFSTGGHYVVAAEISGGNLLILDPGLYSGKYDRSYRKSVTVSGNQVFADIDVLDLDCQNRSPKYYLFSRGKEVNNEHTPSDFAKSAWEKAVKNKILDGTNPQSPATREQLAVVLDRLGLLEDKK